MSSWNPVPTCKEIKKYFRTEKSFMPLKKFYEDPVNLKARKLAVSIISEHWMTTDVDAFVPYLAMNYFDNFVSRSDKRFYSEQVAHTPEEKDSKKVDDEVFDKIEDEVSKVAIACLLVAVTMRGISADQFPKRPYESFYTDAFSEVNNWFRNNNKRLKRPVTPFCFLNYYYPKFRNISRRSINEIIIQAQGEDDFIEYKPSDIAFSSFLAAARFQKVLSDIRTLKLPDGLNRCDEKLRSLCLIKGIKITAYPLIVTAIPKQQSARTETESDQQRQVNTVKKNNPLRYCSKTHMNFMLSWPIVPVKNFVPEGMKESMIHHLALARLTNARKLKDYHQ